MDPDKQGWFPIVAAVSIGVLLMAAVFAFLPDQVEQSRQNTYRAQLSGKLYTIFNAMNMYASSNGGKLPDHVGQLLTAGYLGGDAFLNPRNSKGVPPVYKGEARPGLVYRFGDVIVLYDPSHVPWSPTATTPGTPTSLAAVFVVSVADYDAHFRVYLPGAGYPTYQSTSAFTGVLATDNLNRKAAGLPEVDIKEIEALDKPLTTTGASP